MSQHVSRLVLAVYHAHTLLDDLVAVRDERIQDVTRFLNVVDDASARMQSGLGFIQRDSLLDLDALELHYPGLVKDLWVADPHPARSALEFQSLTHEKTTEALRRVSVFADNLENWVKTHRASSAGDVNRKFDDELCAEFDDAALRNEASVLRSLVAPLPALRRAIEKFVSKIDHARAIQTKLDQKAAKYERKATELREELAAARREGEASKTSLPVPKQTHESLASDEGIYSLVRQRAEIDDRTNALRLTLMKAKREALAADAALESRKRPHESPEEEDGSEAKRARTVPFIEQIIVLTGRNGDADPLVKYWDPDLCATPALRDIITNELRKPKVTQALISYLMTGEDEDGIIADDYPSLAAVSPTGLGVRVFPKMVVKNDCPF